MGVREMRMTERVGETGETARQEGQGHRGDGTERDGEDETGDLM